MGVRSARDHDAALRFDGELHALGRRDPLGDDGLPAAQDLLGGPLDPAPLALVELRVGSVQLLCQRQGRGGDLLEPARLLGERDAQEGDRVLDVPVRRLLGHGVEEPVHRVVVALADRVELVVVALGALERQTQEDLGRGVGAVLGVDRQVLLRDHPALGAGGVAPVEARGDLLVQGRVRQQVAGELLDDKLVEGLVVVQRPHDPVPVRPHGPPVVQVEAVGVGVAGGVEPGPRHVHPVALGGHQPLHLGAVGGVEPAERHVGVERGRLLRGRGEAGEIQAHPTLERRGVGLGLEREPGGGHGPVEQRVDGVAVFSTLRDRRLDRALEGPVLIPGRALLDPAPQHRAFGLREGLARAFGRHQVVLEFRGRSGRAVRCPRRPPRRRRARRC